MSNWSSIYFIKLPAFIASLSSQSISTPSYPFCKAKVAKLVQTDVGSEPKKKKILFNNPL